MEFLMDQSIQEEFREFNWPIRKKLLILFCLEFKQHIHRMIGYDGCLDASFLNPCVLNLLQGRIMGFCYHDMLGIMM